MNILSKQEAVGLLLKNMPQDIMALANFFRMEGHDLFLVGGCVRDSFLGKTPKDYDLCTDALPDKVIEILDNFGIAHKEQGEHFGVVVAHMSEGEYEIATFRADITEGRKPEVKVGVSIEEDVKRRDFTVCAMFMNIGTREIIDLVGGIDDLHVGLIRCVGNPVDRFREDPLRKLRAIRFARTLNFTIEKDTYKAIKTDPALDISGERIVTEFVKTWNNCTDRFYLVWELFDSNLISHMFPGLKIKGTFASKFCESLHVTFAKILSGNDKLADRLVTLKYDRRFAKGVEFLVKHDFECNSFNPLTAFNSREGNDLTDEEILIYNDNSLFARAFLNWKPVHDSAKLMADGFKGKKLGDRIEEISKLSYKKIHNELSEQHNDTSTHKEPERV
jgi:tRNA nucleotidyltransferase/poly(A) polymerase